MKSIPLSILLLAPLLTSCEEEDKALLAEYESQNAEIADLESQILRVNKKITDNYIKDPSKEVEALQTKLAEIETEKEALLTEIAATKEESKKTAEKLEQYKSKYRIKAN